MTDSKRNPSSKRTTPLRDVKQTKDFIRDWDKLSHSGQHDMNVLKEAMLLLVANDAPLPPEWRDHKLNGKLEDMRECHIKGDLVLVYHIEKLPKRELLTFFRVGTHSEVF